MKPISYVDALDEKYGSMGFPPYRWSSNDTTAMTRLDKPLSACTVSMLSSGGVSRRADQPFDPEAHNDHRLDAVAPTAPSDDFQIHDSYYDHGDADKDLNCIFPIDRLHEMVARGEIGAVADRLWSGFMGRIYNRSKVIDESAPSFVEMLEADGVDVLVAIPA